MGGHIGNQNAKGNRGGGRKYGSVTVIGGRDRMRQLADKPRNVKLFAAALGKALRGADALDAVKAYLEVFRCGYGSNPQALDITVNPIEKGHAVFYRAAVEGLDSAEAEGLSGSDVPVESTH